MKADYRYNQLLR